MDKINIIRGTDKTFSIRVTSKETGEPFDLTGLTGTNLLLTMPGEDADQSFSLTPNANGSKLTVPNPLSGKVVVTLSDVDTLLLKIGDGQNMELKIQEGAGPDYDISIVQFASSLKVVDSYFAS